MSPKDELAKAHRIWSRAWNKINPRQDFNDPAQIAETILRARMTDHIALVCDGAKLGLEKITVSIMRAHADDPDTQRALEMISSMETQDELSANPVSISAQCSDDLAVLDTLIGKPRAESAKSKMRRFRTNCLGCTVADRDSALSDMFVHGYTEEEIKSAHGAMTRIIDTVAKYNQKQSEARALEQPAPEQPAPEQPAPEQPATDQPATAWPGVVLPGL
jgi:hypothetical protein